MAESPCTHTPHHTFRPHSLAGSSSRTSHRYPRHTHHLPYTHQSVHTDQMNKNHTPHSLVHHTSHLSPHTHHQDTLHHSYKHRRFFHRPHNIVLIGYIAHTLRSHNPLLLSLSVSGSVALPTLSQILSVWPVEQTLFLCLYSYRKGQSVRNPYNPPLPVSVDSSPARSPHPQSH
jgi:hypothetical protein